MKATVSVLTGLSFTVIDRFFLEVLLAVEVFAIDVLSGEICGERKKGRAGDHQAIMAGARPQPKENHHESPRKNVDQF
jgi:hypothetical protein